MGTSDEFKDVKNPIVRWLMSQGLIAFLLASILGYFAYSLNWAMREGVPSHLRMIQEGYEKISDSNERQLGKVVEAFEREIQRASRPGIGVKPDFSAIADKERE